MTSSSVPGHATAGKSISRSYGTHIFLKLVVKRDHYESQKVTNKKGGLESNLGERKVILRGVEGSQVGEGVHGGGRGGGARLFIFSTSSCVFAQLL